MKNKILCLIALVMVSLIILCSCEASVVQKNSKENERLVMIYKESTAVATYIFVDRETKVQYLVTYEGGICPMVDENGNILLYEGDLE